MNKLFLLVSLLIFSMLLSACKKIGEYQIKIPPLKKVLTITRGGTTQTDDEIYLDIAFKYNSAGKLSRVIYKYTENYPTINHTDTTSYTYSRDTVFAVFKYSVDNIVPAVRRADNQFIALDKNGFILKSVTSYMSWGQPDWTETYINDSNGNCTKKTILSGQYYTETFFNYSGGNMVSCEYQGSKFEYTYYLNKINTIRPNKNDWLDYFGDKNENINLIKTEHCTFSDGSKSTKLFTYEFDADNCVTKQISTDSNGSITWEKYTYQ